jgi:hypothetical protein
MGGLGNQLFQICAVISHAIQNNTSFYFPEDLDKDTPTVRYTYWGSFLSTLSFFTTSETRHQYVEREPGFHYTPLTPVGQGQNVQIHGYFQSPRYFESHWDTIVRMIRFKDTCATVEEKYKEEYPIVGNTNSVSMHFRIGDYKKLQNFHAILSPEYYVRALEHIRNKTEAPTITVYYFCEAEDNDIVSQIIQRLTEIHGEKVNFIKIRDTICDWEQMVLMSLCHHHIIANSTFSWWGAYFSRVRDHGMTCYPKTWFGPYLQHYYLQDLFPSDWIQID